MPETQIQLLRSSILLWPWLTSSLCQSLKTKWATPTVAHILILLLFVWLWRLGVCTPPQKGCAPCVFETGSLFGAWGSPAMLGWPVNSALPTWRLSMRLQAWKAMPRFLNMDAEDHLESCLCSKYFTAYLPSHHYHYHPFLRWSLPCIIQAGLKLASRLLPQLSRYWEYR